jgi:hypothetical protein
MCNEVRHSGVTPAEWKNSVGDHNYVRREVCGFASIIIKLKIY